MTQREIVPIDIGELEIEDLDTELAEMTKDFQPQPPRIRIEHSTSGRHRMFIDHGESYSVDIPDKEDLPKNTVSGIVIQAQMIRAMWVENEASPRCAAVEDRPTVAEPLNFSCQGCPHSCYGSKCKQKVRLLLLAQIGDKPVLCVFPLSPTSIKKWSAHVSRLTRSKAPYIAVVTKFNLEDTKKNGFRWATVEMAVDRVVTKDELDTVKQIRDSFQPQFVDVGVEDYSDPGDKNEA